MHRWGGLNEIDTPKTVGRFQTHYIIIVVRRGTDGRSGVSTPRPDRRTRVGPRLQWVGPELDCMRLGLHLELGFLRQVFADWVLVIGERRSHTAGVGDGELWDAARRARTRVVCTLTSFSTSTAHRESEPSSVQVERFDSQPRLTLDCGGCGTSGQCWYCGRVK